MSSAYRVSLCLLALSLGLINSSLAQPQPSPSSPGSPQSSAESAARAVAEKYFTLYAAEDIDGVMGLWSEKSPDNASYKQNLQRQFATADLSVSDAVISRVKVENEKARLRAMANLTAINRKSNKKRAQRLVRDFAFVREDGQWKVWRSVPAEDKLAAALVKAKTEAERAELLAEKKELVTAELARALTGKGDQFANRREYPQARGRRHDRVELGYVHRRCALNRRQPVESRIRWHARPDLTAGSGEGETDEDRSPATSGVEADDES